MRKFILAALLTTMIAGPALAADTATSSGAGPNTDALRTPAKASSPAAEMSVFVAVIAAIASLTGAGISTLASRSLQKSGKVLEFHKDRIDALKKARGSFSPTSFDLSTGTDNDTVFRLLETKYDKCDELLTTIEYLVEEKYMTKLAAYRDTIRAARKIGIQIMMDPKSASAVDGENIVKTMLGFCAELDSAIKNEMRDSAAILTRGRA
jgi:hypothetical protein